MRCQLVTIKRPKNIHFIGVGINTRKIRISAEINALFMFRYTTEPATAVTQARFGTISAPFFQDAKKFEIRNKPRINKNKSKGAIIS